ncbi:MAG: hypothetical protein Q8N95_00995 [Desulfobacterales bacterium]|nr:hypothetical protein [Desulfobacterales bacterium]
MNKIKLLSFMIVLLFSVPVSAEFYKYIGKDGRVYYTDDFSKVPKEQRSAAKGYSGYEKNDIRDVPETKKETGEQPESKEVVEEKPDKEQVQTGNFEADKNRLDKKQQEMDKEFKELTKEKNELDLLKGKVKTRPETLDYNTRIQALNEKIKNYSEKKKAFEAEAEAYNADVEKEMKKDLERYNRDKKASGENK